MKRRPTTQDITWLLDLHRNKQLDLEPPYQRRSVWTRRDKQFFLDTIFRDFPSPAIFLHKSINDDGSATYHVVDGKQRLQTILDFVDDKLRLAKDFGDVRLDSTKWSELQGDQDLRHHFWNYQIPVEMLDLIEGSVVNEVFDRLNRNSRKLTPQELRHAKFDGWFIATVEGESTQDDWRKLGVVTTARARRMADSQFISELLLVLLEKRIWGFDQNALDEFYAKYDDPQESLVDFSEEAFMAELAAIKAYLLDLDRANSAITRFAKAFGSFYTLWAVVALERQQLPPAPQTAARYHDFMQQVERLSAEKNLDAFISAEDAPEFKDPWLYFTNVRGANTDLGPRQQRFDALKRALVA
jgi:hypothetical protein